MTPVTLNPELVLAFATLIGALVAAWQAVRNSSKLDSAHDTLVRVEKQTNGSFTTLQDSNKALIDLADRSTQARTRSTDVKNSEGV